MPQQSISVAVPWSLSHYIPLNAFHPLYRALFDQRPDNVDIYAWDNVELSQMLRGNSRLLAEVMEAVSAARDSVPAKARSVLSSRYLEHYWRPNIALTNLLPGQIEFHHTAPFPSLLRPFVFHCESFAPVFFPFAHQGTGDMASHHALREHYHGVLANSLCLGIFSHIPETLRDLSRFFQSPEIDEKLHASRIGLSAHSLPAVVSPKRTPLSQARFLFVNSANQNPDNFFLRGGHIVLRFWQDFLSAGHAGKLFLRCARPRDDHLDDHGVDVGLLHAEEGKSVIWLEEYLATHELNALMADAHFFLLPSASLHSVSIMQAMGLGTVPVVSDTVGTSLYVTNAENGVVLEGMFATNWQTDPETGVLMDRYHRDTGLDQSLVNQLTQRVLALLAAPHAYEELRSNALKRARGQFSGEAFSAEFWSRVCSLYAQYAARQPVAPALTPPVGPVFGHCMVEDADWPRIFESVPQPLARLYTGLGSVIELGGAFINRSGSRAMKLHEWSVLAEYVLTGAPRLTYATSIKGLGGRYMVRSGDESADGRLRSITGWISRTLMPYPALYRIAASVLKRGRRIVRKYREVEASERLWDIELVMQDVFGLNVIRHLDKYYAVPQDAGEFHVETAEAGGYSVCFTGNSVREVLQNIDESDYGESIRSGPQNQPEMAIELVLEGLQGFNIIRFSDEYYGILQSDGAFDYDRVLSGGYSQLVVGRSKAEVCRAIRDLST